MERDTLEEALWMAGQLVKALDKFKDGIAVERGKAQS